MTLLIATTTTPSCWPSMTRRSSLTRGTRRMRPLTMMAHCLIACSQYVVLVWVGGVGGCMCGCLVHGWAACSSHVCVVTV